MLEWTKNQNSNRLRWPFLCWNGQKNCEHVILAFFSSLFIVFEILKKLAIITLIYDLLFIQNELHRCFLKHFFGKICKTYLNFTTIKHFKKKIFTVFFNLQIFWACIFCRYKNFSLSEFYV